MAVYGKLKRKVNYRKHPTLSPQKHSIREYDNELLSSSQNLFSIPSSSTETLKNFTESTDSLFESKDNLTAESEDTVADEQPSSPICKSQERAVFSSIFFKGFEELEEVDYSTQKRRKISDLQKRNKNTIFAKKEKQSSGNVSSIRLTGLSDDEFSCELSASLKKLNSRLYELQSKVNVPNDDDLSAKLELKETPSYFNGDSCSRHYGATRSFKEKSDDLSDDDEEEEEEEEKNDDDNCRQSPFRAKVRFADDPLYIHPADTCKSLEELKRSGELDSAKLECEMMLDQMGRAVNHKRNNSCELLQLKLNLFSKIKSDANFESYLKKTICGKTNCLFYRTITDLLIASPENIIINFQLMIFFRLSDWNKLNILSTINEIRNMGNLNIEEYAKRFQAPKKLLKDLLNDWVKMSDKCTLYSIAMEMLNNIKNLDTRELTDAERCELLEFCTLALDSLDSNLLRLSLSYLRSNPLLLQNLNTKNVAKSLVRLLLNSSLESSDHQNFNLILECSIILVCYPENSHTTVLNSIMFTKDVWSKLWNVVEKNNVLDTTLSLNEGEQNQCLVAIGYIFSFISFDSNISASNLSSLSGCLDFAYNVSQTPIFNVLQIHFLGYLGCISYHFLNKFDLLSHENVNKIKGILGVHKMSKYKSEEILSQEIEKILLRV